MLNSQLAFGVKAKAHRDKGKRQKRGRIQLMNSTRYCRAFKNAGEKFIIDFELHFHEPPDSN